MTTPSDDFLLQYFKARGFPDATPIAAGMEGAVYLLSDRELVAKAWYRKKEAELVRLKDFYGAMAGSLADLVTPVIEEVRSVGEVTITFERYLPGRPLEQHCRAGESRAHPAAVAAVSKTLHLLRSVPPFPELFDLPVLEEPSSPWRNAGSWSEVVEEIIERRLSQFGDQLARHVPDLPAIRIAIREFLRTRDREPMGVLHGDLCTANVMVDDRLEPIAVFDFGFLTIGGDPAFDASISSAIFDMYGPNARFIDDQVTKVLAEELGYQPEVLLAYRAVYCLMTSNAYSPDGSDGHFRWCMAMLRRGDVRDALRVTRRGPG